MSRFKEGDMVELKSGGPTMTVNNILIDGELYECAWFAGSKFQEGRFHENALVESSDEAAADKD